MPENDIHTGDIPLQHNLTRMQIVNRIIDLMFDTDAEISPELHARFVDWLFDPRDNDIKDRALFRKFNEIIDPDNS